MEILAFLLIAALISGGVMIYCSWRDTRPAQYMKDYLKYGRR